MTKKREIKLSSSSETSSVDDNDAPPPPPSKQQQKQKQQQQQGSRGRKTTNSLGSELLPRDGAFAAKGHSTKMSVAASAVAAAAAAMPTKKDAAAAPPPKTVTAATTAPAFKNSSFRAAPPPHRKRKVPNGNSNGSCLILIRPGVALLGGSGNASGSSNNKNGSMASTTLSLPKGPLLQTTIKSTTTSTAGTTSRRNAAKSATIAPAHASLRPTDNPSRKKKKQKHYLLEDDDDDDIDSFLAKKTVFKRPKKNSVLQSSSSSAGSVGSTDSEMPYTQNLGLPEQAAKLKAIRLRDDNDKKTEPLRPGDVIAYSNPVFVAGTREAARVTQVLATNPDQTDMPLELDNAECLPADLRVKRVKEYNRRDGRLYDHPGVFRPINHFRMKKKSLPTLDGTTMTGFRRQVERVQEIMASTRKEMEVIPEHLVKEAAAASRATGGAAGKKSSSINSPCSLSSDGHDNNGNASSDDHESAAPTKKPKQNIKSTNGTASSNRAGLKKHNDLHMSSSSDSELDELLKNHTSKSQTQSKGRDKPAESRDNRVLRTVGNSKPEEKSKAIPTPQKPAAGHTLATPGQRGDVSTCNADSSQCSISSIEATVMGRRSSQSAATTATITTNAAAPLSFGRKDKSKNDSNNNDDDDDDGDGPVLCFKTPLGIIDEKASARGGGAGTLSLSKVSTSLRTRTAREKADRMSLGLKETSYRATSASSSVKERGTNGASREKAPRNASKDERISAFADDSETDDSLSFTKTISSSKEGRSFQNTRTRPPLPVVATGCNSKETSKDEAAKKKKRKSSFGVKEAAIRTARGLPPKSIRDDDDDEFSFKVDEDDDDHHSLDACSMSSQSISREKKQKRAEKETKGKKNKNAAAASKVKGSNTSSRQQPRQPQPASLFLPQRLETNNDHVYGNEMDSSSSDDDDDNNYPNHRQRAGIATRTPSSTNGFSRRTTSQMDHAHGGGYSSIGSSFHSSQSSVEGQQPQRKGKSCSPGMSRLARLSTAARNSSSSTAKKKPPAPRLRPMMLNMQSTSCLDDIR